MAQPADLKVAYSPNPLLSADTNLFVFSLPGSGFMAVGSDGFCKIVSDVADAIRFRVRQDSGATYYRVVGGEWDDYYLSYSNSSQVGLYGWNDARSWTLNGGGQLEAQNGKRLACPQTSNGLLYLADTGPFLDVAKQWPWSDYSGWMGQLRTKLSPAFGRVPLFQLPVPGSHDSGTYDMGVSARTQNLNITEQLVLGIRYFDLRPRVNNGDYYIHHGPIGSDNLLAKWPQPTNLDDFPCILLEIRNFLLQNKDEVVFLKFQSFDGHDTDDFNTEDHQKFRKLLNAYLTLIVPQDICGLTLDSVQHADSGTAIVFYDNIGSMAGEPGSGDSTWDNIWPFKTDADQASRSECIRLWDPFWDDTSESIGDEGHDASGQVILTERWKTYHHDKLLAWQAMTSGRVFVTQAQMQVARGSGMKVSGYFSKVERSAVVNNHLNVDLFSDWMKLGVPTAVDSTTRMPLRPNVLSLDFVEFGSYCEKIIAFFSSLDPSTFDQKYGYSKAFVNAGSFALTIGSGEYVGNDDSWAVPVTSASTAMRFRIRVEDSKLYFMLVGGDYDGRYMSLNTNYCIGWYQAWNDARSWSPTAGKLLSDYSSEYVAATKAGDYIYANASATDGTPVSLDWS